jgi:hypothetical protein
MSEVRIHVLLTPGVNRILDRWRILFEETSISQHGVGLRKDSSVEGPSQTAACDKRLQNDPMTVNKAFPRPQAESNLRQKARLDLDVLAAAANAAVQSINVGLIEQEKKSPTGDNCSFSPLLLRMSSC